MTAIYFLDNFNFLVYGWRHSLPLSAGIPWKKTIIEQLRNSPFASIRPAQIVQSTFVPINYSAKATRRTSQSITLGFVTLKMYNLTVCIFSFILNY